MSRAFGMWSAIGGVDLVVALRHSYSAARDVEMDPERLDVAAEVSATVVEVDDGSLDGVFAAVSGPRVHGTHGARKCAHLRPRICM